MPEDNMQKPTPDPTILTTEQLLREVERVKEYVDARLIGDRDLTVERFNSAEKEFSLVERQRVEQKKDTKDAVDAALAAAKEAVKEQTTASERAIAKSEASTAEQLKQLNATFTAAIGGVTDVLGDVKERVSNIESVKNSANQSLGFIIGSVGVLIAIISVLSNVLTK